MKPPQQQILLPPQPTTLQRYAVATLAVVAATCLRIALLPLIGNQAPFFAVMIAILVASWYGGFWPGVYTTVTGVAIGCVIFLKVQDDTSYEAMMRLSLVLFICIGIGTIASFLCELLHRANRKLRQYEVTKVNERQFWWQICNTINELVWYANTEGDGDFYNQQWCDYVGTPMTDSLMDGWKKFIHSDDIERVSQIWQEAVLEGKSSIEMEYRLRRHDGEYRWFLARGQRTREGSWVGTLVDIHDRKCAEQAAVDEVKHKDEFLAMLAHELRNPLAVIVNGMQVLDKTQKLYCPCTKNSLEIQQMVLRQSRHLVKLVDDLLDVGRFTSGKIVLRRKIVDLNEAVKAGVESNRFLAEKKQHKLTVVNGHTITVNGDVTRLTQVISNLVHNAVKYTPANGEITVTTIVDGSEVVVSVKDNGIGIAPEHLEYIFGLFSQVDHTLDRTQGGLGIGLTLVKNIVEMHEGTVGVRSGPDGSEFTVRLPIVNEPLPSNKVAHPNGKSRTILIVDDSVDAASSLASVLRCQGHKVFTANNGEAGLKMLDQTKPDVVLLDIGMPGMNGYELARRIRESGSKVCLAAVTGYDQIDGADFDYHLVKPVEPGDLTEILSKGC